ncbi:endonuclease/exonuclease/phosphatase family protein [Allosalinactinospora lopnorensis]|uniref:endonuclease/exonuclease/phosphatase family protein n=1 Tax=Allosalinactinospora lopnorensis TaxID=1352348 RepID=UPI00308464C8
MSRAAWPTSGSPNSVPGPASWARPTSPSDSARAGGCPEPRTGYSRCRDRSGTQLQRAFLRDDRAAVARVITACRADVVCLQEAPRFLFWRSKRRALARSTGLEIAASRRVGGLAILLRPGNRVRHTGHRVLRRYPGLHTRAVSAAVVELAGRPLTVACTHLDLAAEPRLEHAREVLDYLAATADAHAAPAVLAGDINCEPEEAAWRLLAAQLDDVAAVRPLGESPTFTARRPRRRIDAIFTSPGLKALSAGVPVESLAAGDVRDSTDHRPVLAEIEL